MRRSLVDGLWILLVSRLWGLGLRISKLLRRWVLLRNTRVLSAGGRFIWRPILLCRERTRCETEHEHCCSKRNRVTESFRRAANTDSHSLGEDWRIAEELGKAHHAQIFSGFHFPSRGPIPLANSEVRVRPLRARQVSGSGELWIDCPLPLAPTKTAMVGCSRFGPRFPGLVSRMKWILCMESWCGENRCLRASNADTKRLH